MPQPSPRTLPSFLAWFDTEPSLMPLALSSGTFNPTLQPPPIPWCPGINPDCPLRDGLVAAYPIAWDREYTQTTNYGSTPIVRSVGTVAEGAGNITPGLPAGTAENDILVCISECQGGDTVSVPGYTEATHSGQVASGSGLGSKLQVFWKRAGSSESAPTITDPGNHAIARIIAISGCTLDGNPFNTTNGGHEPADGTGTSGTIPGATTTSNNCLVLAAIGSGADVSSTTEFGSWTNADLGSLTERMDNMTTQGNGGGFGLVSGTKNSQGTYSSTTVTAATTGIFTYWTGALMPPVDHTFTIETATDFGPSGLTMGFGNDPERVITPMGPALEMGNGHFGVVPLEWDGVSTGQAARKIAPWRDFTIAGWIKPTRNNLSYTTDETVFSVSFNLSGDYPTYVALIKTCDSAAEGNFVFHQGLIASMTEIGVSYQFDLDVWQHVALVSRGSFNTSGRIEAYVNGHLVGTDAINTVAIPPSFTPANFKVGLPERGAVEDYDDDFYEGQVSNIALWSRGLTENEVLS